MLDIVVGSILQQLRKDLSPWHQSTTEEEAKFRLTAHWSHTINNILFFAIFDKRSPIIFF